MKRHTSKAEKNIKTKSARVFALIAAVFTAIAVAVTCAVCLDKLAPPASVDGVGSGDVSTSTTYTNLTGDKTAQGVLVANDIIDYSYAANNAYSIKLPKGTYKLEVWGAQGGYYDSSQGAGAKGGYTYATYEVTPTSGQYIYIYVGGQGTSGTGANKTGGYNGGGTVYIGNGGGAGGGATHMATASGLLNALKSNQSAVLLVGGGGGGSTTNAHSGTAGIGGAGGGGNANGGASTGGWIDGSGYQASGGTQTSGGGGGKGATTSSCSSVIGQNGDFGKGGDSYGATNSTAGYEAGGGGGGGWWGGGGGGGDSNSAGADGRTGGGGGSGHIKSGLSGGGTSGNWSGNGKARITVISVNQPPKTKNATVNAMKRGVSGSVAVSTSTIATDPEGTAMYFTNGTSSNLDTFTTTANTGIFLDSSCSTVATKYLTWTWSGSSPNVNTFNITSVKMYPRVGTDGCTANGRLTLYARVRDSFGASNTRGWAVIMFYVQVPANTVSTKSAAITGSSGNYVLGSSTTTTKPTGAYNPTTSNIYNPNGTGRYTAIFSKPLKYNEPFTVKASELLSGLCSYDQVVISLNSTSNIASSVANRKYKIKEFDENTNKVTAYNFSKAAIANAFSQISFVCLSPDPNYQVFPVTLYVVEKSTAYGSSYPNVVPNITTYALDIVFGMQNSRPVVGTVSNIVDVAVGETRNLALSSYFKDDDGAISSATHSITGVVVPSKEFVQLNADAGVVAQTGVNAGFYNIGAGSYTVSSPEYTTSATTAVDTGFHAGIAYNSTSTGSNGSNTTREAFMRYTYANDVLTVVGLRSSFSQYASNRSSKPGHFYLLLHIQDKRDTADNGIWLPLAFRVGYSTSYAPVATVTAPNTGTSSSNLTEQSAVSTMPTASGSVGQSFYFAPMAVNYGGSHVFGQYLKDGALTSDGLQPLAIDGDNYSTNNGLAARSGKLNEFLRLSDSVTAESIVRSVSDVGVSVANGVAENRFIKAEIIDIYLPKSYFATGTFQGGRVIAGSGTADTNGFKYVSLAVKNVGGVDYYVTNGIKITLKSATMNRYFYANATVVDSAGKTSAAIDIALRVNNTAPTATENESSVATFRDQYGESYSTYEYDPENGVTTPTFTFKVPLGNRFIITPYDFVSDYNMTNSGVVAPAGGFTLNGLSGVYDPATGTLSDSDAKNESNMSFDGLFASEYGTASYVDSLKSMLGIVDGTTAVKKVSATAAGTAAGSATVADQNVLNDKLFFARSGDGNDAYTFAPTSFDNFAVSAVDTSNYLTYNMGNKVKLGQTTYGVDFIMITAVSRSTRPAYFDLTVRDRYGNSSDGNASFVVRIAIEVVNTAPTVKDVNRYQELAVAPVNAQGNVTLSSVTFSSNGNGDATGLMKDLDNDIPEFLLSSGVILTNSVANVQSLIGHNATSFDEIINNHKYLLTDDGTVGGRSLGEYVTATLVNPYELYVTAKSSTKAIAGGVYVCFLVSDGNGSTVVGYVRIEVVDSAPVFNTSTENGFDLNDPLWSIKTTSNADISRDRYIVGSTYAAEQLKSVRGAVDADIKLIATDDDALHGKLLLSRRLDTDTGFDYVNLAVPEDKTSAIPAESYDLAVPNVSVATGFGKDVNAAALVFTRTLGADGSVTDEAVIPNRFVAEVMFFVDGDWISRDTLISEHLAGNAIGDVSMFFDSVGRFVYPDWAVHIHATEGFESNVRLGLTLSIRDRAEFGGDTAGLKTAYDSDRRNGNTTVSGYMVATVYHSISTTGIRTKDEYAGNYADNYVVEYTDAANTTVAYVPTYDGDANSVYPDGSLGNVTYNVIDGNNWLAPNGDGTQILKARAQGQPDNTLAGVNAGALYNVDSVDALSGVYNYPSVIEIPSDGSEVFVPMSYFGLLQSLVASADEDGSFDYLKEYVGYDVGNNDTVYSRDNIAHIADAITISDGNMSWSGSTLNNNPYINVDAFDMYSADGSTSSAGVFANEKNKPYYNNRLAVVTIDKDGQLIGYERDAANRDSFVGNGSLMYLEEQAVKLQEHNFGLVFNKTEMRTGVHTLTLTVDLAKSEAGKNAVEDAETDRRSVTVNIHIENSKIDLSADGNTGDVTGTKYDEEKGTYYVDLKMPSSTSKSFALSRRDTDTGVVETISNDYANVDKIAYTDADYRAGTSYRDRAYFYSDSFNELSAWSTGAPAYNRALALNGDGSAFENTASSSRAQNSILNYLGIENMTEVAAVDSSYQPNGGKYGSNIYGESGIDGYSSYFNASLSEAGRVINITASRKTAINDVALKAAFGNTPLTQQNVTEYYAERGLVAEYADATVDPAEPTRVYYPFKTLVYDSCGAGWMDASYVALEFRIEITNAAPVLKNVGTEVLDQNDKLIGREYRLNLAVGNSVTINLYDLVSDSGMYVQQTGNNYALATKQYFENTAKNLDLETGDYLDSPFAHDIYLGGTPYDPSNYVQKDDGTYYRNGGGLTLMGSTDRDVTMWIETASDVTSLSTSTVPSTNNLSFTVNRRTTATVVENGVSKSVSINEYRFTVVFYDSYECATLPFTFIITITNQSPTITATERHFTMHSGDDLTVLTTYYDNFIGGVAGGSVAYNNSLTKKLYDARTSADGYGETHGDGSNNETGSGRYWSFRDIDSSHKDEIVYDSTVGQSESGGVHLGYLGLANDDTPWKLRISSVSYYTGVGARLWVEQNTFTLGAESDHTTQAMTMSLNVRALSACVNEPITITLTDGEDGVVTCTLYFTVISSAPNALDYADPSDRRLIQAAGLEGETAGSADEYLHGTYRMFTVPSGEIECEVEGFDGKKTAKQNYVIDMTSVAKDPDGDYETSNMTLFGDGNFAVNDVALVRGLDGVYRSEYFDIRVLSGGRSFSITATGFNPSTSNGYEKLTFRVADYGNGSYENSIEITIHVYTLYGDMINASVAEKTNTQYTEYLRGGDKVHVKSYDEFYGAATSVTSDYAFVKQTGNVGNDGNTASPITDKDVDVTDKQSYSARLYAFIDADESGEWHALSDATLKEMFAVDPTTKSFALKPNSANNAYFIGGVMYNGTVLPASGGATDRLSAVNRYVNFEFVNGGTAVSFVPNASTLDNKEILLYVEVEKHVDTSRAFMRKYAALSAGTLFRLEVEDSAPAPVTDAGMEDGVNFAATGYKGDVVSFKIHDADNPFGALFTDADFGDTVTIKPFTDGDYEKALASALRVDPDLDWAAKDGKPRAFTVDVDEATNTLSITVNRRMDSFKNDKYAESVSFPIVFEGVDRAGKTAKTVIMLTIGNRGISSQNYIDPKYDAETGIGYSYSIGADGNYVIDAQIRYSHELIIDLNDFLIDPDRISTSADCDSFRFDTSTITHYPYEYLTDTTQEVYWYETYENGEINPDRRKLLATVEPVGADKWHRTAIKISAADTTRTLSAKTYLRVLDRSTDKSDVDAGVYITLNIVVMNDAPYVISGKEVTSVTMIGSDSKTPASMLFYIGDFVADNNGSDVVGDVPSASSETYLRIFSQQPSEVEELYSKKYSTIQGIKDDGSGEVVTSSALFTVTIPQTIPDDLLRARAEQRAEAGLEPENKDNTNLFNQWFIITPNEGYYGAGSIEITVADGDSNTQPDSLSTSFRINVRVVYDQNETDGAFNAVSIASCKTKTIDIGTLMPELEDKLGFGREIGVIPSADGNTFGQSEFYSLTSIALQNSADSAYVEFKRVDNSDVWNATASKLVTIDPIRVNVKYVLKADPTFEYSRYFMLSVVTNQPPTLKYDEITFVRYDRTDDQLRDLDDSNTVKLEAWQLFGDADDPDGKALRFISAKSQVPSIVSVALTDDNRYLTISFAAKGRADITVEVTDETGEPVLLTFTAINEDLPEGSLWVRIMASFESNMLLWIIIAAVVLLLLIIIIIIITVAVKRKRAREELEALLVSEMEIEEQMLKLAGGDVSTPGYQSYGFLPPVAPTATQQDPGMMLGAGNPDAAPADALALNPAQNDTASDDALNGGDGE